MTNENEKTLAASIAEIKAGWTERTVEGPLEYDDGGNLVSPRFAVSPTPPAAPGGSAVRETPATAEARIMQDYRWGNLTKLGVANHLRRAGFNLDYVMEKANALASDASSSGEPITAQYTNWRGERAPRTFIPHCVFFGSNEWHPEPQVLIEGTDCVTGELRTFSAAGFATPPAPNEPVPASGGVEAWDEWKKLWGDGLPPTYVYEAFMHGYRAALSASSTPAAPATGEMVEALSYAVSCLVSLRKNYEEPQYGLWGDVSRAITQGNAALASTTPEPGPASSVSGERDDGVLP